MKEASLLRRLKNRKMVQWAIAYLAAGWAVLEAMGFVAERFVWPETLLRASTLLVFFGFFVTLTLAWYHGEKGRQRASGPELLIIAMLLVIAGVGLSLIRDREPPSVTQSPPADYEPENVAAALNRLPSLAVLPFANRSGNPNDQYFTDGIQDDLLTSLQRASGLRVISRTSSDAYRNTNKTIQEIARELGVDYVLEGAVQRAGDRVRINVQLIDAPEDRHLWARNYDRVVRPDSLFELQSEIVQQVYAETGAALLAGEWMWAARRTTMDQEALELFAQARAVPFTEEATTLLAQAVERDPEFVAAYATLASYEAYLFQYYGRRSEERRAAARAAAERALNLAPDSPDAQLAMGRYLIRVEKDFRGALYWLGQAAGTLRGDYDYHLYRAYSERRLGQWKESIKSLEAVLVLSPRRATVWVELGKTYLHMRRYEEAERALQEALRLAPALATDLGARIVWGRDGTLDGWKDYLEHHPSPWYSWWLAMIEGRHDDALALLDDLPNIHIDAEDWYPRSLMRGMTLRALGEDPAGAFEEATAILEARLLQADSDERVHAALGLAYAGLGRRDDAVREARRAVEIVPLERDALSGAHNLLNLATVHSQLGEVEEALELLEIVLSRPSPFSPGEIRDHFLLSLVRSEPRLRELIEREWTRVF